MADRNLSRAHVGLALASALVVLLASVVAISRLGDSDDRGVSTSASGATSSTAGLGSGASDSGPATGTTSGAAGGAAPGAEQAAGAADALATAAGAKSPSNTLDRSTPQGSRSAATDRSGPDAESVSAPPPEPVAAGSGDGAGGSASSGTGGSQPGGQDGRGGQEAQPQPSQDRPEQKPLLTASASVGQGAQGGVVGLTLDGGSPELDVTVGTDQVVGNHPPSQGTGIAFGGRFLNPPPTVPLPPG